MASKKMTTKGSNAAAVGAGVAALATAGAAAGYYFYGTANAKKHRKAASAWAKGMKSDVTKKVKTLKKLDAKSVAKIVDEASATYHSMRGVNSSDVHHAAKELKANWKKIQAELAPSKAVKKAVKSVTPKAMKKVVKKEMKKAKKVMKKVAKKR